MKPAVPDPPEVHHRLWAGFMGAVGWDIGANCGQTLPEMTRRFRQVIAFEPATECLDYLHHQPGVLVLPIAVSDIDATIDLVAVPDKIATGQLVTAGTHGMEWNPDAPGARPRRVLAATIDTLADKLGAPDFCKVDTEGHEVRVLLGATRTLAAITPAWLIEFHSADLHRACVDILEAAGYDVFTIRHPHYPPGGDMWFQHGWIRALPEPEGDR
jgi:FkbM family methyltransferase